MPEVTFELFAGLEERIDMALGEITMLQEALIAAISFGCRATGSLAVLDAVQARANEIMLMRGPSAGGGYEVGLKLLAELLDNERRGLDLG
jgi:hypothetical protein